MIMTKKNNKVCLVCGETYTFCPSCREFDRLPRWMSIFHEENCKNIFETLSSFYAKEMTKEEACTILKSCDLSNRENFPELVKAQLTEVLGISEQAIQLNTEVIDDVTTIMTDVESVNKKNIFQRKK